MKTWIQNGHVLDPLTGTDKVCDVLVSGSRIEKVGTDTEIHDSLKGQEDVQKLDAKDAMSCQDLLICTCISETRD